MWVGGADLYKTEVCGIRLCEPDKVTCIKEDSNWLIYFILYYI